MPVIYTFDFLGSLGNWLFIYAAALGARHRYGVDIRFNPFEYNTNSQQDYRANVLAGVCQYQNQPEDRMITQPELLTAGQVNLFVDIPPGDQDRHLRDYFQNALYFAEYPEIADEFRAALQPYRDALSQKYPDLATSAFLHLRKGDYLHYGWWIGSEYYKRALTKYPPGQHFYVLGQFSGDSHDESLTGVNYTPVEAGDEVEGLALMTLCGRGGITCNSTYSWWGGFLNDQPERLVVSPIRWLVAKFNNPAAEWLAENDSKLPWILV